MSQSVKNLPEVQAVLWFYPWAGKTPGVETAAGILAWGAGKTPEWRRQPVSLPGNPMDRGARWAAVRGVPAVGCGSD